MKKPLTPQGIMAKAVFGKLKKEGINRIILDFSKDDFDIEPLNDNDVVITYEKLERLEKTAADYLTLINKK